jgi:acyl carrier protein
VNDAEIRIILQEELGNIAPEMDLRKLDPGADLRDALDIDSMDFLNFVIALHRRLGVDIPERSTAR